MIVIGSILVAIGILLFCILVEVEAIKSLMKMKKLKE